MSPKAGRVPARQDKGNNAPAPEMDPKAAGFRLRLAYSPIHRWGVYAAEPIPAGRKVVEYTGERISNREIARRTKEADRVYVFRLDKYCGIDGAVGGSGAEYINHSCEPSLHARLARGHILYFSLRAIDPGEELTVDYRFPEKFDRIPCYCGAPKCRGTINLVRK